MKNFASPRHEKDFANAMKLLRRNSKTPSHNKMIMKHGTDQLSVNGGKNMQ